MAVGPIYFDVTTKSNPIDDLNNRLKTLGRKEVITSIKSFPFAGGYNHDVYYINGKGEEWAYGCVQHPTDSYDFLAEKFFAHLGTAEQVAKEREDRKRDNPLTFKVNSTVRADILLYRLVADQASKHMEYQQYLDDHKAMTLGTLFGENRFPRARERAFLDFRTLSASQSHYECEDHYMSAVKDIVIRKTLCLYFAHHVPGFKEHMLTGSGISDKKALIRISWLGNTKSVLIPLSQDMPWFTAAQQTRDTLREWIDAAAQKNTQEKLGKGEIKLNVPSDYATQQDTTKQEAATASNDYIVSIWDINYPKARVEYHEGIERLPSHPGLVCGVYKAGAKVSGIPRTDEPFDIALKYAKGDIVVLRNCTWVADGEVQCERIEANGKSAPMPGELLPQRVAAEQQIPKGVMVNSDGEVVGKAAPARGMAYLNGVPVGVMTNIEYGDATMRLNTDDEGRVTTTAQQVRDAIDRGMKANPVPTEGEIKRALKSHVDTPINITSTTLDDYYRNQLDNAPQIGDTVPKENLSMPTIGINNESLTQRAKAEAVEVAYRTAAIKLPELVRKQLVKRMASKGGKPKSKPSQARLSLAEDMLSGDEGSLIVAGILSLALSASPEFIKSKMPWLDLDRLAKELRLNVETRIACAVADMLGMYLDGALDALKEAFGGSQQLLLAEGGKSDESALFNGVPKAETVRV